MHDKLSAIDRASCPKPNKQLLQYVQTYPDTETLDLSNCAYVNTDSLQIIATGCPGLL